MATSPLQADTLSHDVARLAEELAILIVDDDALILMNAVDMIEDIGHSAVGVTSAREALGLLENREFDVIVTDLAMPGMSGTELIAAARARFPRLCYVVATGYGDLPHKGLEGIVRLSKPYDQEALRRAVQQAVALR